MSAFAWPLVVISAVAGIVIIGLQTRANERALAEACIAAGKEWRPASTWSSTMACLGPGTKDTTP